MCRCAPICSANCPGCRTFHRKFINLSASEAVAALLRKLAFYTRKDPAQMDRLIRGSALANSKFDERRGGTTRLGREIPGPFALSPGPTPMVVPPFSEVRHVRVG
jgi:hypothetical protein